ncbi:hypothetical protein D3C80_1791250 [compost metagenome]
MDLLKQKAHPCFCRFPFVLFHPLGRARIYNPLGLLKACFGKLLQCQLILSVDKIKKADCRMYKRKIDTRILYFPAACYQLQHGA